MTETKYPNIVPSDKQKQYSLGPSILDSFNPCSQLNKSHLRGFFNMTMIFGFVFIFTKPILNKIQNGYFLQPSLYTTFMNDYFLCVLVWPLFFLWSFTSYLIQKLILKGISQRTAILLQHTTQAGLFLFSTILILIKDWCSTHAAFVIIQACAHFMKMHSYTTVNRDYRQEHEESRKQNKSPRTNYPENINVRDFILFMWTPWLVYDNYPRKSTLSLLYIVQKSFISLSCILTAYIIHTQYIIPYIEMGNKISFIELLLRQMLPGTILIIILFFVTFENITNIFAEITKLDHRQFYEDWWNSTTFEQFNRKWNKPVHVFLYRHVYLQLMVRWKFNKIKAQLITFIFSAVLHEFLLAIIFRIVRPIFLGFIVGQVPLIYITKFMTGKKSGSYLFWFGIILGPSLIIGCYLRVNASVTDLFTRI